MKPSMPSRPRTLTPREQVTALTRADAFLACAQNIRQDKPDMAARLRGLAVREMAVVVRSRLIVKEWCER